MSTLGGYLEYREDVQFRGGYHEYRGGYYECRWGYLGTVGDVHCRGGYHDFHGGYHLLLFEYSTVLNTPTVLMIFPHVSWLYPPWYSNSKIWYPPQYWTHYGNHDVPPHVSWYPPQYWTHYGNHDVPPHVSWYPPRYWASATVLKISPHCTHDMLHGTEHTLHGAILKNWDYQLNVPSVNKSFFPE